jgi:hypothetical protein
MTRPSLHPGLELRLRLLEESIDELKWRARRLQGVELFDAQIELGGLEERCAYLRQRLETLEAEGDGALAHFKSAMAQIRFDFRSSIEAFEKRLDLNYRARRRGAPAVVANGDRSNGR